MKRSTERILTTHTRSLPRESAIAKLLITREKGEAFDPTASKFVSRGSLYLGGLTWRDRPHVPQ